MRWLVKAGLQKVLSALPGGAGANYALQRYATRSLPRSEASLRRKLRGAHRHLGAYLEHGPQRPLQEAVFYEFGVGWDLAIALSFWQLGVNRQILVDVRPNLRLELANTTLRLLQGLRPELEEELGGALREPPVTAVASVAELEDRFGIVYLAPVDVRATGLESRSVDFVSSSNTLEHVPEAELVPILAECRRLLRADGLVRCRVDLRDHHSYFDRNLSPYNFLRFSKRTWRLVNSSLMYQNRLRARDYHEAFVDAGFEIVVANTGRARDAELDQLRGLRISRELRGRYSLDELAAPWVTLVARPAGNADAATHFTPKTANGR